MNSRLNTNKKPKNSKSFLIIALLIIISGAAILYFITTGGQSPVPDENVVRMSIRVTDPTKPKATATATVATKPKTTTLKTVAAPKKIAPTTTKKIAVKKTVAKRKTIAKSSKRGMYAIHVASFNAKKYAVRLERAIDRAGYNAYITTFIKNNVNWHRVRVGFFNTKEDASKTSAIISKRFKQPGAWLVRPPKEEVEKNKI